MSSKRLATGVRAALRTATAARVGSRGLSLAAALRSRVALACAAAAHTQAPTTVAAAVSATAARALSTRSLSWIAAQRTAAAQPARAMSSAAKPGESVFGIENIKPSTPTTGAASPGADASAELKTTLATGASTSQSPSTAFQVGASAASAAAAAAANPAAAAAVDPTAPAPKKGVRELLKQYGGVWVATYGALYVGTLASLYGLLQSGVLGGQDAIDLLQTSGLDKLLHLDVDELNPKHGNFAVAWVATKFTEPVRLAISVGITPRIDRRLRAMGWIKPKTGPEAAAAAAQEAAKNAPTQADKASGRHAAGL